MKINDLIEALETDISEELINGKWYPAGTQAKIDAKNAPQPTRSVTGDVPVPDTFGQAPAPKLDSKGNVMPDVGAVPQPTTTTAPAPTATTTAPTTAPAPTATTTAPAGKKPGINWGKVGSGALNAATGLVKGAGDIASQVATGATQAVGAAAGGFGKGYHTARSGGQFGSARRGYGPGQYNGDPYQGGGAAPAGGGDAEVAQLKSDIAKITGRLDKAGIAEKKHR